MKHQETQESLNIIKLDHETQKPMNKNDPKPQTDTYRIIHYILGSTALKIVNLYIQEMLEKV